MEKMIRFTRLSVGGGLVGEEVGWLVIGEEVGWLVGWLVRRLVG